MPADIRTTSAASADLTAAYDWYEQQSSGLGKDFVRMLDVAFASIARRPDLFPPRHRDLRRVLLRRFPYAVYYRIDGEVVRVVAVLHTAMDLRRLEGRR